MDVSFYDTRWPPGAGPALHLHPYAEVFLVHDGLATFTVGGDDLIVEGGHVVVVPAETPHRFHDSGAGTLHVISIQPSDHVVQRDLS